MICFHCVIIRFNQKIFAVKIHFSTIRLYVLQDFLRMICLKPITEFIIMFEKIKHFLFFFTICCENITFVIPLKSYSWHGIIAWNCNRCDHQCQHCQRFFRLKVVMLVNRKRAEEYNFHFNVFLTHTVSIVCWQWIEYSHLKKLLTLLLQLFI